MPAMTRRKSGLTRKERRSGFRQAFDKGGTPDRHLRVATRAEAGGQGRYGSWFRPVIVQAGVRSFGFWPLFLFAPVFVCLHITGPGHCRLAISPRRAYIRCLRSLRLAVQDAALSRRKQGFDSPRECQLIQWVNAALCVTYTFCTQLRSRICAQKPLVLG